MKFLSIIIPLIFLLTTTTTATTTTDLINKTCLESSKNNPNIDYTFCMNSLRSTPLSQGANLARLGLISVNLTKKNVTATLYRINNLIDSTTQSVDDNIRKGLDDCYELYSNSVSTLSAAARDFRARRFNDANIKISSVMDDSSTCEQGFEDVEVVSPLKNETGFVFELCAIALSIMNLVNS